MHFVDLLKSYLRDDLSPKAEIFVDERLEVGADWVDGLGESLATSKVVVAIFSGSYFGSDWCVHELDLIYERFRAHGNGSGLLIPVLGHDGDQIPDEVARLQNFDIKAYRVAGLNKNAADYFEFSKAIKHLSPAVANAVNNAPPFQESWVVDCQTRFSDVYKAVKNGQRLPPTQFNLKPRPSPMLPQIKP